MRTVIQRVTKASVEVEQNKKQIQKGLVILVGVSNDDTEQELKWLSEKILNLRIFPDDKKEFELSILDIRGEILVVPQFTLYGDCSKGRRPDLVMAAKSDLAKPLYEKFVEHFTNSGLKIQTGEFGRHMLVEIFNDGPVTFIIENGV